jgi:tetratricopeptide (TPR) repeat protein
MFGEKEDFAEARKLYTRALRIDEKTLGPDHPDVADCLNALGYLLKIEGNYSEAEPILRRALAIDQKKLGPDHPRTRNVQANLNNVIEKSAKEKQTEK